MSDAAPPRILVVALHEATRRELAAALERQGHAVGVAGDAPGALARIEAETPAVVLLDLGPPGEGGLALLEELRRRRPAQAVVVATGRPSVESAVAALRLGAVDHLERPLAPGALDGALRRLAEDEDRAREGTILRSALRPLHRFGRLVSRSDALGAAFRLAAAAAGSRSPILIRGERGTGKEALARAVHAAGPRAAAPFVVVPCAALTDRLLEASLYGAGLFEAALGGTLFLDDVADLGPRLQLELLRVLEDRRFRRAGRREEVDLDIRMIAATRRDLRPVVEAREFRGDLFDRLGAIPIALPPLRERREDIPVLADHLLRELVAAARDPARPGIEGLTVEAICLLLDQAWEDNVRELRGTLERGLLVARGPLLGAVELGLAPRPAPPPAAAPAPPVNPADLPPLREVERRHIAEVFAATGGNVTRAARILGIDRVTLYAKLRRHGLRRPGEA